MKKKVNNGSDWDSKKDNEWHGNLIKGIDELSCVIKNGGTWAG